MSKIGSLFRKNMILGIKDVFVLLEVGFSVVVVCLLLFVIPEEIDREAVVYVYDETNLVRDFIAEHVGLEETEELGGEFYVDSREALIEGMTEQKNAVGMIIRSGAGNTYDVELLTQPYTTETMIRYIELDIEDLVALIAPPYDFYPTEVRESVRVEALQWGLRDEIPFNQRLVPIIAMFMVGIMGLFVMISLIGQERSEDTLKAFRITPAGLNLFLLAKHLVLLAIGTVTYSIIYLPMLGFAGYLPGLVVIWLTVIVGSCIGSLLGTIFDSPMNAILWVMLLMIIFALPSVSLMAPAFSPWWIKLIPTYHTLFALDAAMFPDNNSHIIWQGVAILGGIDVVLLGLSFWLFGVMIRREA
jgi:hypothetical protein